MAAHPVRERLVAALVRALAAAGRDNEALLVYQRAREALADTLGADPSPQLAALHVALLRGELAARPEEPGRAHRGGSIPRHPSVRHPEQPTPATSAAPTSAPNSPASSAGTTTWPPSARSSPGTGSPP